MLKESPESKKTRTNTEDTGGEMYVLRLFVAGILPYSVRAVINTTAICEKYLKGRYQLEVIDIYQHPELAITEDIIAIPLLIKMLPLPEERMIGDMSDTHMILNGLNIL